MTNEKEKKFKTWLIKQYRVLDSQYAVKNDLKYSTLVNFSKTEEEPISRWFYYVEGYSPKLVNDIFVHLKIRPESYVFDPFSGSGTTLLVAKNHRMPSIGFEINPFSAFMIKTKTQNYLKSEISEFKKFKFPKYKPISNIYNKYEAKAMKNWFDKTTLIEIELIKREIKKVKNTKVKMLLLAALLSSLETASLYKKGGNGLKRKRVFSKKNFHEIFQEKLDIIFTDLENTNSGPEPVIINDSCLKMTHHLINNIDISMFSPPYVNCFDPFEVYKLELWIGDFIHSYTELRSLRKRALSSNLNADLSPNKHTLDDEIITKITDYLRKKNLWDMRIPDMIDSYFIQMSYVLSKLHERTKLGGFCVIVVGNSAYGNIALPADLLLARLGEKSGFHVREIIVARRNETSSQQYEKIGDFIDFIRESIIILEKKHEN